MLVTRAHLLGEKASSWQLLKWMSCTCKLLLRSRLSWPSDGKRKRTSSRLHLNLGSWNSQAQRPILTVTSGPLSHLRAVARHCQGAMLLQHGPLCALPWLFSSIATHSRKDYHLPFNTHWAVKLTQSSLSTLLNLESACLSPAMQEGSPSSGS